jgi:hypothetical protein
MNQSESTRRSLCCCAAWLAWLGIILVWCVGDAALRLLGRSAGGLS